jgi:D-arabinose 1-dehydrogenase-like Zn-dependent alcohol dehydrogenase
MRARTHNRATQPETAGFPIRPGSRPGARRVGGAPDTSRTLPDLYPTDDIPSGVRLTGHSGDASDLPRRGSTDLLDAVAEKEAVVPIGKTFRLDQISEAHTVMEANTVGGKVVVLTAR